MSDPTSMGLSERMAVKPPTSILATQYSTHEPSLNQVEERGVVLKIRVKLGTHFQGFQL